MNRQRLAIALFAFIAVCVITGAHAVSIASAQEARPSVVKTGVWINSIEKVDVSSGTFTIDFYLWFKYHDLEPDIEFMNGTPSKIDVVARRENYLELRVKGVFIGSLDFREFPLDEHFLAVKLEDKTRGDSQLVFEPDFEESGVDPNLTIAGWNVKGFNLYEQKHTYPDENYSQFVFGLTVYRSKVSVIFKNFLPIFIITLISLLTFSISVKNFGQRIGICVTTLMSAVAYHLAALGALPPLSYLTFFDRVMLVVYTVFLYNLAVSVQAMRYVEVGNVERAEKFETRMQNLLPLVVVLLSVVYIVILGFLA